MRQPFQYDNPACRNADPDLFVEETVDNLPAAKKICAKCDHRIECAEYGVRVMVIGVWGGLSTDQRSALAKQAGVEREQVLDMPRPYRRTQTSDDTI